MNTAVKVSIIVPVYNVEQYLSKCLDSITAQSLKEIEILAVNDGSTDKSLQILEEYSKKDFRIKVLNKPNSGLSDARNFAFDHICGEYVGFIDSDDFIDAQMYETMYQKAISTDADIVECNLHHTWENGDEDTEIGEKLTDKEQLIMNGRSVVWNKIYKTSWLLNTEVRFPSGLIYEDVNFYCKLIPSLNKIEYVDDAFVHYVQRGSSINNQQSIRTLHIIDILSDIYAFYEKNGYLDEYHDALEFLYIRILLCSSMGRMARIPDKQQRKKALKANWEALTSTFPNWKKNRYYKCYTGKNAAFMKSITPVSYRIYGFFLPFYYKIKQ